MGIQGKDIRRTPVKRAHVLVIHVMAMVKINTYDTGS